MSARAAIYSAALAAVTATSLAPTAFAQQLDPGISCLEGEVDAYDWAELTSKYKESIWDTKSAIRLRSYEDTLNLTVTDNYGATVCEDTADSRTRCKFGFSASYSGIFNIRVDNPQTMSKRYKLCAE